jgi:hypothetical protein
MKKRIFILASYSPDNQMHNSNSAFQAASALADKGFYPYVPHSNLAWDLAFPRDRDFWVDLSKSFLLTCDAVVEIESAPSESVESLKQLAAASGIPVFKGVGSLVEFFG